MTRHERHRPRARLLTNCFPGASKVRTYIRTYIYISRERQYNLYEYIPLQMPSGIANNAIRIERDVQVLPSVRLSSVKRTGDSRYHSARSLVSAARTWVSAIPPSENNNNNNGRNSNSNNVKKKAQTHLSAPTRWHFWMFCYNFFLPATAKREKKYWYIFIIRSRTSIRILQGITVSLFYNVGGRIQCHILCRALYCSTRNRLNVLEA